MKSVFLNQPKVPRGLRFYLFLLAVLALILSQFFLFRVLYQQRLDELESLANTTPLTTAQPTQPTLPAARSVSDPQREAALNAFFGPLPKATGSYADTAADYPLRGIYLGQAENLDAAIELAQNTEINCFVIDVKEAWGLSYASQIPLAKELKASQGSLDLSSIFQRCHEAGVYVIARMVCFKDELMPEVRPDLCIHDADGELLHFGLEGGGAFANPYDSRVWDYLIAVAEEVHSLGADEIQFDYVRFPTGAPEEDKAAQYSQSTAELPSKEEAINRFLETASIRLQENQGIPLSADLFSIVMSSALDGSLIGQNWQSIGLTGITCLSPMIYPSHYANGSFGSLGNGEGSYIGEAFFDRPDTQPYEVVHNALLDGWSAMEQIHYARIRPWLQAFTATYLAPGYYVDYGAEQIRAQIQACYEMGLNEWLLWNASHSYPAEALLSKAEAAPQIAQQIEASKVRVSQRQSMLEAGLISETTRRFPIATPAPTAPALP